ncbi:hypothetical protein L3Q82_011239 [Scortum barcoo]|uniref:Uncharacterized protein n=1 Tax=Scortum barcoo TaxID=214431 RepID=A0ACB8W9K6_9TELE|nr:hypothetical protein L3Q82_011239 [Scortum barcoo]
MSPQLAGGSHSSFPERAAGRYGGERDAAAAAAAATALMFAAQPLLCSGLGLLPLQSTPSQTCTFCFTTIDFSPSARGRPPIMRFRIYKKKVVILTLVVVICGLAFWSSGRQKKSDGGSLPKEVETARRSSSSSSSSSSINNHIQVAQATPAVSREPVPPPIIQANDTHQDKEKISKPEVDNTTLVYRGIVFQLNFDQTIRNEEKFKAARQKDDLVVVVQVHNRPDYLKLLVDSLRKARGVESILLIFSHDYWSPEINKVVASVDFCQVLQIFFPFSIQLYPQEFPGHDPRDCPRDIPKKDALKLGCINAEYPDSFGHYREAKFSQTKHHWWWKLHFVWDRVRVLKDHKGLVPADRGGPLHVPGLYPSLKADVSPQKGAVH